MIFDQNIVKEADYKYRQAFQNVYVSTKVLQSIFPQAPCLALIDATRFASYTKPEISLLEALEFIAFDWWPTDEYGKSFKVGKDIIKQTLVQKKVKNKLKHYQKLSIK